MRYILKASLNDRYILLSFNMRTSILLLLLSMFAGRSPLTAQFNVDSLSRELSRLWERSDLPGFAVSIVTDKEIIFKKGFGYADVQTKTDFTPETTINLGPVSKAVVGVAVIKAVEDGALTMDSEINEFLPFEIRNPYYPDIPILVRHLITHSSTILDTRHYPKSYIPLIEEMEEASDSIVLEFQRFISDHQKISMTNFLENILTPKGLWFKQRNFQNRKPGAVMNYSNLNASLAALVLENSTFYPFKAYTQQRIFDTLEMYSTAWSVDEINNSNYATLYFPDGKIVPKYQLITYPDGGLLSNVSDLSNFLKEMIIVSTGTSGFLNDKYGELLFPGDGDLDYSFWGLRPGGNIGLQGGDPGIHAAIEFNRNNRTGTVILCNVNVEQDDALYRDYLEIRRILSKYEALIH